MGGVKPQKKKTSAKSEGIRTDVEYPIHFISHSILHISDQRNLFKIIYFL